MAKTKLPILKNCHRSWDDANETLANEWNQIENAYVNNHYSPGKQAGQFTVRAFIDIKENSGGVGGQRSV